MSLTEHYSDYKWVKVKRYNGFDKNISCDENNITKKKPLS